MTTTPPDETPEEKEKRLKRWAKKLGKRDKALTDRELKLCEEEKIHDFNIEYKSQTYNAFYTTSMEKDKSILTVAVAGLGFLIAIIQSEQLKPTGLTVWLLAISCLCYLISIFLLLTIFKCNKDYLINLATDNHDGTEGWNKKLTRLDGAASISFYLAIMHSVALGIVTSNFIN